MPSVRTKTESSCAGITTSIQMAGFLYFSFVFHKMQQLNSKGQLAKGGAVMAKYAIGVTEAGDASVDLSWERKMRSVDGAILITKNVSADFRAAVMRHSEKVIVHATVTGFGGSVLEPNVPPPAAAKASVMNLVGEGFSQEKVVIRVDPIIPTEKGLNTALTTIESFMAEGFCRYRISVIDMYPHVRNRFKSAGLPLPYGEKMYAGKDMLDAVDAMLVEVRSFWLNEGNHIRDLRIESCAEPRLAESIKCGCISSHDLALLRLDPYEADAIGSQRQHCMCYSGKRELLSGRHLCKHQCLYCYWKNPNSSHTL